MCVNYHLCWYANPKVTICHCNNKHQHWGLTHIMSSYGMSDLVGTKKTLLVYLLPWEYANEDIYINITYFTDHLHRLHVLYVVHTYTYMWRCTTMFARNACLLSNGDMAECEYTYMFQTCLQQMHCLSSCKYFTMPWILSSFPIHLCLRQN